MTLNCPKKLIALCLAVIVLSLVVVTGASAQTSVFATLGDFEEKFYERTPVSANATSIVGINGGVGLPEPDPKLGAFVPGSWAGRDVCARIKSFNGLYETIAPYVIAAEIDPRGQEIMFDPPIEQADRVNAIDHKRTAVTMSLGTCEMSGDEYVIAYWYRPMVPGPTVRLYLHSFQADMMFLAPIASGRTIVCDPIDYDDRPAFDTECTLQIEDGDVAGDGFVELSVLRMKGGEIEPSGLIKIYVAGQ